MDLRVTVRIEFFPVKLLVLLAMSVHEILGILTHPSELLIRWGSHYVNDRVQLLVLNKLLLSVNGHFGFLDLIEFELVNVIIFDWRVMLSWRQRETTGAIENMVNLVLAISIDL